jgi:tetratricopeptide (TPR) repeat protein
MVCALVVFTAGVSALRSRALPRQEKSAAKPHSASPAATANEALRFNTLGVAYMNQQKFADAQKNFEQALDLDPKFGIARLNLGIALLSQQKLEAARTSLEAASRLLPQDPYAWYNLGLAYKDSGETEKGITAFKRVTELTPEADAHYFVGYLESQLQRYDEAIAEFEKALAAFPFHASAEFGIARAYQRKGDLKSAREHLERFQKITSEHLGTPFGAGYGDQGRYSLAELARNPASPAPPAIAVSFKPQPLIAPAATGDTKSLGPSTGACFIDYDGDGKPDVFLVSGSADGTSRLLHNLGAGRFADVTHAAGLALTGSGLGCAAGDFYNDGHTDLAVCLTDGVHLLRNKGDGKFDDVTQAVGIRREKGCAGLTFVDYDHDGDLDLYITMQPAAAGSAQQRSHNVLWRNNGNSTFTEVSAETALDFDATGAGVVTTDFNNDRAIDFVIAGGMEGASIYLNPTRRCYVAREA